MSDYEKLLREERARAADEGHGHTVQAIDRVLRLAVPASDPRALALEEAARAIENDPLVQCGAVMDGPHFAEIVRSLGSGSESPRDQGAPARTFAWAEIHDRPGVFRGLCLVCGDSFSGIRSAGKADVERAHPEFCPACLAGRPVETGSEPTP